MFTLMIAFLFAFVLMAFTPMAFSFQPFARGRPILRTLTFSQEVEKQPERRVLIFRTWGLGLMLKAFRGITFMAAGGLCSKSAPCLG